MAIVGGRRTLVVLRVRPSPKMNERAGSGVWSVNIAAAHPKSAQGGLTASRPSWECAYWERSQ